MQDLPKQEFTIANWTRVQENWTRVQENFENYLLKEKKVSKRTLRNYRSDLSHFIAWAQFTLRAQGKPVENSDDILPHLSSFLLGSYKGYHIENRISASTTNRRLSALRNFTLYLQQEGYLEKNPAEFVTNVRKEVSWSKYADKILAEFEKHLQNEGISNTTLKNYLSDVRQFLAWCNPVN